MEKIKEKIVKMFESKTFLGILCGLGAFVLVLVVFYCGVSVGFHKASYGRAWGENYEKNFGMMGPRNGFYFGKNNFPNAHGAAGKILKITLPTLIVQDKDNTEKIILLKDTTKIQKMMYEIEKEDLRVDDFIVIIGSPNKDGQIEAKFMRVMPNPELLNNNQNLNDKPIQ